jgi:hypothetical protein
MPGSTGGEAALPGTGALITESVSNASTVIRAYPLGMIPPPPVNPLPPLRRQIRPAADEVQVGNAESPADDIIVQIVDAEYLDSGLPSQQRIPERGDVESGRLDVFFHNRRDNHEDDAAGQDGSPNTDNKNERRSQS